MTLCKARDCWQRAFGGVQLIVIGDYSQLEAIRASKPWQLPFNIPGACVVLVLVLAVAVVGVGVICWVGAWATAGGTCD